MQTATRSTLNWHGILAKKRVFPFIHNKNKQAQAYLLSSHTTAAIVATHALRAVGVGEIALRNEPPLGELDGDDVCSSVGHPHGIPVPKQRTQIVPLFDNRYSVFLSNRYNSVLGQLQFFVFD